MYTVGATAHLHLTATPHGPDTVVTATARTPAGASQTLTPGQRTGPPS